VSEGTGNSVHSFLRSSRAEARDHARVAAAIMRALVSSSSGQIADYGRGIGRSDRLAASVLDEEDRCE
jgi:hypothetical protein